MNNIISATRDYDELQRRFAESNKTVEQLQSRLEERDHELNNLRNGEMSIILKHFTKRKKVS